MEQIRHVWQEHIKAYKSDEALKQIEDNRYLIPYSADSRDKWIIGANFSTETRNISEWEYKCV